jgi:protein-disulfide isomerase
MKKDSRIFEALLAKQKRIAASADGLGITLGNPNATNTIIKVCNPYCGPCAKAHPAIHELLEANENIKVQILFTATADEKDYRNKPVKHLLAIDEKKDASLTDKALDDWYMAPKKEYDAFAAKYPMNGELKEQDKKVEAMNNWCNEVKIEVTPTFFVNGYQLPENYTISDLKYFLDDSLRSNNETEEAPSSPFGGVRGG